MWKGSNPNTPHKRKEPRARSEELKIHNRLSFFKCSLILMICFIEHSVRSQGFHQHKCLFHIILSAEIRCQQAPSAARTSVRLKLEPPGSWAPSSRFEKRISLLGCHTVRKACDIHTPYPRKNKFDKLPTVPLCHTDTLYESSWACAQVCMSRPAMESSKAGSRGCLGHLRRGTPGIGNAY